MATEAELESIREMGRQKYREMLDAGLVPPLSEDQLDLARRLGAPLRRRELREAM